MTKTDIVNLISLKRGLKKKEVLEIIDTFLEKIIECTDRNEQVEIRGFGTFYQADKKARKVHSPIAGRILEVPAKKMLAFRGSKATERENNKTGA